MEENNFERQVQQKMDELKIHPSDAVWEKIAARIEKKKPSNRGVLLLVLLFFVFLTGGYVFWNIRQHPVKEIEGAGKTNSIKNSDISIKENETGRPENSPVTGTINQQNNQVVNDPVKNPETNKDEVNKSDNKNFRQPAKQPAAKRILRINSDGKSVISFSKQKDVDEIVSAEPKSGITEHGDIQKGNRKIPSAIKDPVDDKGTVDDKVNKDSLFKPSLAPREKATIKDTVQQAAASAKTVKHSKKNRWKPGLLFSAGISRVGNDFLGFANSTPLNYSNSIGQGTPGNGSPGPTVAIPSKTKPALGIIAGVFAERDISHKIILAVGINFKSFNLSNKVGVRNDTTGYYYLRNASGNYNSYKSYYNFIELPVTLKVRIGKSKKVPWFWHGGLVVSQLVSTNALQFNQNSRLYYKDNSIFNKTQIGLNTAFSVSLFSKRKNSVEIGPYFYYSVSNLADDGLYNKKHFVFTGLRTEIIFGR